MVAAGLSGTAERGEGGTMYICQDFNGAYFVASEWLAAALDRETVRAPINVALAVQPRQGDSITYRNEHGQTLDGSVVGMWSYPDGRELLIVDRDGWPSEEHIDISQYTILSYAQGGVA